MKINPISFGRTIKVNTQPHKNTTVIQQAVDLINSDTVNEKDKKTQSQLRTIFADRTKGKARIFYVNNKKGNLDCYIVTGKTSKKISRLLAPFEKRLNHIRDKYNGKYSREEEHHWNNYAQYDKQVERIILETQESKELKLDYDPKNQKIKSISLIG